MKGVDPMKRVSQARLYCRGTVAALSLLFGVHALASDAEQGLSAPTVVDFTQNGGDMHGWMGCALPGVGGTTSVSAAGLCMSVPGPGINLVGWVSPDRIVELVDDTVYRLRMTLSTDQTATDAIPLFIVNYDNYVSTSGGADQSNIGGFFWMLDVDGGAQGIGRPQGRTTFDFYIAPNAFNTPQWKSGAFTPQADPVNDIRIWFEINDTNASLLSENDSGTICVSRAEILAIPRTSFAVASTPYNPPINTATHFAPALGEANQGTASIDNAAATARFQVATSGSNRLTLGPTDPLQPTVNRQLYPVVWTPDTLYRLKSRIRAESSEHDPVDVIFMSFDTSNIELGASQYTTRGAAGGILDGVASPKLAAADYEGYFHGQGGTASSTLDANRLRPEVFFFNAPSIAGDGTGSDAFIVESLSVETLLTPP